MTELPSPAAALESRFRDIEGTAMQGMPMLNAALRVRAVGFRPWDAHWLGVLVTPWFMNLVLMPRVAERWHPIGERQTRHFVFPAGVFEFIGGHDEVLGPHLDCSLFSPMFDFADAATAEATAAAALDALFDTGQPTAAPPAADTSKRAFLFGAPARTAHGP